MTESAPAYRLTGCECGQSLDSVAHRFWCVDGPAGGMRSRPRAAEWRSDLEFIEVAAPEYSEDMRLATKGGYDKGAGQRMRSRHQGYRLALQVSGLPSTCVDSPTDGAQDGPDDTTQQRRSAHRGVGAFGCGDGSDSGSDYKPDDPSGRGSKTRRRVGAIDNGMARLHSRVYHPRSSDSKATGQASHD